MSIKIIVLHVRILWLKMSNFKKQQAENFKIEENMIPVPFQLFSDGNFKRLFVVKKNPSKEWPAFLLT
jgi:hypothetical protein